jgi:Rrf2 family transcriptional regulator, iron-sulfur cluster assembly transcription factor
MILQRSSELGIRAALFLAQQPPGKLSPVHEIAEHTGASEAYLAKILQRLTCAGLVRSFRGPGRGMKLAQPPSSITLDSLVRAIGGSSCEDQCVLGFGACSMESPCTLHKDWVPIRRAIQALLQNTTLANLVEIAREHSRESNSPEISRKNISDYGRTDLARRNP